MRIAYICADPGVPVFGTKGCSIHVQEIVRAMLARGDEVELFVARAGGKPPPDLEQCFVREMTLPQRSDTHSREVEQVLWNQRITHALDNRPTFHLLYERHSLWSANAIRWAKRKEIPSILEVNAPLIDEQTLHRQLVNSHLAGVLARQAMCNATITYLVSDAIVPYCRQFVPENHPLHVIANGVNIDRFSPSTPPVDSFNGFTIGFVGSLKPWHGLDLLLEAVSGLCQQTKISSDKSKPPVDFRLLIVGDGPRRAALEKQLEDRTDLRSRVKFVGAVSPESVPGWINSMDLAVAPYPDLDNFYFSPLKIYEYMASGRAVLASSNGQLRNIIQHGSDGWLYSPGKVDCLLASLTLLRDSPRLRANMGRTARTTAERHSWHQVLKQILALLDNPRTEQANFKSIRDEISI